MVLVIDGWNGDANGGGKHQVLFGSNASGLTPQQVAQIQFRNPAGMNGLFSARILASGEIVPVAPSNLQATRIGGTLSLQWGAGWVLQSATNAAVRTRMWPEPRIRIREHE